MQIIPPRSVDFIFDTTGQAMQFLSLVVPSTGSIVSVSTMPSGTQFQNSGVMRRPENPRLPWLVMMGLNAADAVRRARAWRWGVGYEYMFLDPKGEDLMILGRAVEEGRLRPVVGAKVDMRDVEGVRKACGKVFDGKGGIGKTVFEVVKE